MYTEEQIRQDLAKLKLIAAEHKAPGAALETETITIEGVEQDVFSHIPSNLGELYALGLEAPDRTFLVYQQERYSFAETLDMALRMARVLKEQFDICLGDRVAICARNSPEWCISHPIGCYRRTDELLVENVGIEIWTERQRQQTLFPRSPATKAGFTFS
jgi:long-chain acyl-CoA synthetase